MKIKSDGYSFFLISRILDNFVGGTVKSVDFFSHGLSLSTTKGTIDAFLHPRFSWIFFNASENLEKERASGWAQSIKDGTIDCAGQIGADRILFLDIKRLTEIGEEKAWRIWFEFFGGFPNAFLTKKEDGKIVRHYRKSFSKKRNLGSGDVYVLPVEEKPRLRYISQWLESAKVLKKIDPRYMEILKDPKISNPSKIALIPVEDYFYAVPGILIPGSEAKNPEEIISELSESPQNNNENQILEKEMKRLKKNERDILKSLSCMINPQDILALGEKIKSAGDEELSSIKPLDKNLEAFYLSVLGKKKGNIIENLFSLYRKNLRKKALYEKKLCDTKELIEKIERGEFTKSDEKKDEGELSKYRVFLSPSGKTVAVSKNAESADYLTMKIARRDDLFFHAKDSKGSHVILFLHGAKEPLKEDIEFAAAVAAGFSLARFSSLVPVQYALRKYVRKPRKAPKGLVVLDREKVIFVKPFSDNTGG
ncbi:NFACT family protein [candidate division WOR-3 bacterium]|nr:NFACT family protein [candidate division WOR-3 bacterium]